MRTGNEITIYILVNKINGETRRKLANAIK